jgi:hypothetical protein
MNSSDALTSATASISRDQRQMRKFGPSAAMYRYTVRPTARRGRKSGLRCSERGEEVWITARVAADRYSPDVLVAALNVAPDRYGSGGG